jgi:Fe2+ or Zn2+ uptake regulation protein
LGTRGKARFVLTSSSVLPTFEEVCHQRGIRIGKTRRAVAKAILAQQEAFDFDAILDAARTIEPTISRGTVYLSLRRFRSAGLIQSERA